jgi:glycine dehydrogenase subunit 1
LLEENILGGYDLSQNYPNLQQHLLIAVTEMNSRDEIETLAEVLAEVPHD